MSSDERLAKRASRGDTRAFEAIYRRYHQDLYRFCLAMVGNPQDAQDALQNTMVKVMRALPGEEREIQLKPWLYRIARNESIEALRKRRDTVELEPRHAGEASLAETAETRERLRVLLADLGELPERQRSTLVMRELSGLEFEQIGAAFGTSAAVARQTLYEARLSLRQLEAGREMHCSEVTRELSDADGRVTRRREIRAHLRSCAECRAFRDGVAKRHGDMAALAPLPLAISTGLLHGALAELGASGAGSVAGGSLVGTVAAGAGKAIGTSAAVKSAAAVAVVAVVGVSAADRGGLIDVSPADPAREKPARIIAPAATEAPGPAGVPRSGEAARSAEGQRRDRANASPGQRRTQGKSENAPGQLTGATTPGSEPVSQRGQDPPGGGYGRSASERKGRPEQLPEAASHGQQTAAANKPAQAPSPPGGAGTNGFHKSPGGGPPAPKSTPAPKAQAPAGEVPIQRASSPEAGNGPPPTPPGLER